MSKKSKHTKLVKPMKQLQQSPSLLPHVSNELVNNVRQLQQQLRTGDFAGCISSGEAALSSLPKTSPLYVEVLSLVGTAHGMLRHYQQSYDLFSEAITLHPTHAQFWHNRGLACYFMTRPAEAVQNLEHALSLSKNASQEERDEFNPLLEEARKDLKIGMAAHEEGITFEEYLAREQRNTQALSMSKQEKWQEAEQIYRELAETGAQVPSYWGNLGVALMMQSRFDEAEAALKQALTISPDYAIARDNLKKLPKARRSKLPLGHITINPYEDEHIKQSLTVYEQNEKGRRTPATVIEKVGHAVATSSLKREGKQPPRYNFFLNIFSDTRFLTCPQCKSKTQPRKFSLVICIGSVDVTIIDKKCRHCNTCDLLIIQQDELEDELAAHSELDWSNRIDKDYQVIGTIDKEEWRQGKQPPSSMERLLEYLRDFKEVFTFVPDTDE